MPIIINGGSRSAGGWWAKHLDNTSKNERVELVEISGLSAETMADAFREMQAISVGTRCKNYFYQANINPREDETLTPEQWREAVDTLEKNLGLTGQPRFVVEHEKAGRTHRHVIWSRIDPQRMTAISDSLTAAIHEQTSRALEIKFDLEQGRSVLVRDRDFDRPERRPKKWEMFRGQETGIDPRAVGAELKSLWERADSGRSFQSAVEEHGYILAAGDRRNFLVIDQAGDEHSLARRLGVKSSELAERMKDVDRACLPGVGEAKAQQRENYRAEEHTSLQQNFDRDAANAQWEENVADAGIAHDQALYSAYRDLPDPLAENRSRSDLRPTAKAQVEPALSQTAADIRIAWNLTRGAADALRRSNDELETALAARGITLAQVTVEDVRTSERTAEFAWEVGSYARVWREGEVVAVDRRGTVYRLNAQTTGDERSDIEQRLAGIDRDSLMSVTATKQAMREASIAIWKDEQRQQRDMSTPLTTIEVRIAETLASSVTGTQFAADLDDAGLTITRATAADLLALDALRKDAELAGTVARSEAVANADKNARHFGLVNEGDFAAVTRQGDVFRLNPTALDFEEVEQRLSDTQRRMPSIVEARAINEVKREQAAEERLQRRTDDAARATARFEGRQGAQAFRDASATVHRTIQGGIATAAAVGSRSLLGARKLFDGASKLVEGVIGFAAGLFGAAEPKLTRQQINDMERAEGNVETHHARHVAAAARASDAQHDWRMHAQKSSQQERDLRMAANLGTPPTAEANLNRDEYEVTRERERGRGRER